MKMLNLSANPIAVLVSAAISVALPLQVSWGAPNEDSAAHTPQPIRLSKVSEPPELKGLTQRPYVPPPEVDRKFLNSRISKADPKVPESIPPAIKDLDELIAEEPQRSDFYLIRAELSCYNHAPARDIIDDVDKSIAAYRRDSSSYANLQGHYAVRAHAQLDAGQFEQAVRDLDAALREDYQRGYEIFNDGGADPRKTKVACAWSLPDFDTLQTKFPKDSRPLLYRGLYLDFYTSFHGDDDLSGAVAAFKAAAAIDAKSPLPHFFLGQLDILGRAGGLMSTANASCIDDIVPRTEACKKLDVIHEDGIRELTTTIALDPSFAPAFEIRAEGYLETKQYQQAIRDYSDALIHEASEHERGSLLNDRALAETNAGALQPAVEDFGASIKLSCKPTDLNLCNQYVNRANAFVKLRTYDRALDDLSMAIRSNLGPVLPLGYFPVPEDLPGV